MSYVKYNADDYAQAIANLLPQGAAWPRNPDSNLIKWVSGCAQIWAYVSSQTDVLLFTESDPYRTQTMLADWEANYGLPDKCLKTPLTSTEDRRNALLTRITTEGGASRQFFIDLAAKLGYTITIKEYVPFRAGASRAGLDVVSLPQNTFCWTVTVDQPRVTFFKAGVSKAGLDPLARIIKADDLECIIKRWKPAHTEVFFQYLPAEETLPPVSG